MYKDAVKYGIIRESVLINRKLRKKKDETYCNIKNYLISLQPNQKQRIIEKVIKGFKGFDKNLKCRDYQFEIEKDFIHEGEVKACESGFHLCENPLDVFNYYSPAESRFAEVEGSGDINTDGSDSKVAVSRLSIKGELTLNGLINTGVKFIFDRVKWETAKRANTGYRSAATNTGDQSAATNTGDYSAAIFPLAISSRASDSFIAISLSFFAS